MDMELYEFFVLGCSLFSAGQSVVELYSFKQLTKILYVICYVLCYCDVRSNGRTQ